MREIEKRESKRERNSHSSSLAAALRMIVFDPAPTESKQQEPKKIKIIEKAKFNFLFLRSNVAEKSILVTFSGESL